MSGKLRDYYVYAVLLSDDVLDEPRFRDANPSYRVGMPCVYIGMTGLQPRTRLAKHKRGELSNRFVELYGERVIPVTEFFEKHSKMEYDAAKCVENDLAEMLRNAGYGVWQA